MVATIILLAFHLAFFWSSGFHIFGYIVVSIGPFVSVTIFLRLNLQAIQDPSFSFIASWYDILDGGASLSLLEQYSVALRSTQTESGTVNKSARPFVRFHCFNHIIAGYLFFSKQCLFGTKDHLVQKEMKQDMKDTHFECFKTFNL